MRVFKFKYSYNGFKLVVFSAHLARTWVKIGKEMNNNLLEQLWSSWGICSGTPFG